MSNQFSIQELVSQLAEALRKYDRLTFDESLPHEMGAPATPQQIDTLESYLQRPLPAGYKEFLLLHNGWSNFQGGSKLLGVEDHTSDWVHRVIAYWNDLWEPDLPNPFRSGMVPVLLGTDENSFVVMDWSNSGPDGQTDFVEFDYMHEENRFSSFEAFMQRKLEILQFLIARHTKGVTDEDSLAGSEG